MPKIVDHQVRRAELCEALWRVLAREGIEGVTVRSVAAEAGWTRGIIEHYFESKEQLLLHACRLAGERSLAQAKRHQGAQSGRQALRAVLLEGMPMHGERPQAARIWFSLLLAAVDDPLLAAEMVNSDAAVRAVLAGIITEMIARGELSAALDPQDEARSLLASNLGLSINAMMQPEAYGDEVVESEVDQFLARLLRSTEVVSKSD